MLTIKAGKGLDEKQVNHPATIFSTTTRPACVASYTEKKLFVLKNYVFYESPSNGGERSEALEKIPTNNDYIHNSRADASYPGPRNSLKNHSAERRRAKPKSWVPNGGGMKPYNSPEVQNAIRPADECIIDVNSVKPKVDTWFRPRNGAKLADKWFKSNKYDDDVDVKRTNGTPNRVRTEPSNPTRNICSGKTVKRMASFWDSHLKSQPHTMAAMLQKSHISLDSYTRLEEKRKEEASKNLSDRPKSQGSDRVVQEHTLRPSELLNRQGKLKSIEDILINPKFDGLAKKQSDSSLGQTCSDGYDSKPPDLGLPQTSGGEHFRLSDDEPKGPECSLDSSSLSSNELVNATAKQNADLLTNSSRILTAKEKKASRPKHIVRLHSRWALFFRVLMLMFWPVTGTIHRKASIRESQSGRLKAKKDTALKNTVCPEKETVIESPPGFGDPQDVLIESEATSQKTSDVENNSLNVPSIHCQQHNVQDEDDDLWYLASCPLICESPISIGNFPEVSPKYPLGEAKESSQWQQPVSNGGLRIALYIENRILVAFVLVQAALVLIVLSIKWLQRLTS